MALSKSKKTILIVTSSIALIIVLIIIIINFFLGNILESKIREALNKSDENFEVSLRDVRFNIISGNLKILDLEIQPDSSLLDLLKKGHAPSATFQGAEVPLFKIAGINLYKAIVDGEINLRKIELSKAHITIFKGKKPEKEIEEKVGEQQSFKTDSIYIKGLNGIDLSKILLHKCKVDVYDLVEEKYVMQSGEINISLTEVDLIERPEKDDVFELGFDHFILELSIDEFKLPGGMYNLHVKQLLYSRVDSSMQIKGIHYWPQYTDLDKMAKDMKFTKEMFNIKVRDINVYQLNAGRIINDGEVYIDSILVNELKIDILKDKRYPFNEELRPKLLNQLLTSMELPLNIEKIKIENSELIYREKNPGTKEKMTVSLNKLKANLNNVTSVKDSIKDGAVFRINLQAKLMDKAEMNVHFVMPLNSKSDTMFYSGTLGSASFITFNKAIVPALGVEFKEGKLNSLSFSGSSNSHISKGKMTMKYENLVAEVYKKESKNKNKFMSWAANAAVYSNNPGKKGKLRVAHIEFERVMYKGFGNFMWKSVQSGLVNSVAPTAKHDKIEVADHEDRSKKENKEEKKKKKSRKDRRNKKK